MDERGWRGWWIISKWGTALVLVLVALGVGYLLRWLWEPSEEEEKKQVVVKEESKEEIVWTCSMHAQIRMPKPGKCPLCGMPLVRTTKTVGATLREFSTTKAAAKLMEIEVAPVERRFVVATIRMVGKVDYDETRLAYITAWVPGRLDRLYVDYTGVSVKKGDHMVSMYSPELLSAQDELLEAIKTLKSVSGSDIGGVREMAERMIEISREKLRLWGLAPEQIAEIEERGTATEHITINAPVGGIVVHKNALEGMYVKEGTRIYTIADLSTVWVKLDAYESDLMWLKYGQKVEFTTVSYPGETFTGTIAFIDPILNEKTRSVKVRVNVPNLEEKLKPGMFVKAVAHAKVAAGGKAMDESLAGKWICPMHPEVIKDAAGTCDICQMALVTTESLGYVAADPTKADKPLVIPATAVLRTGTRAIVYKKVPRKDDDKGEEKPTYQGIEIVLGPRAGDFYLVRSGLKEGDQVVVKGNFKIDSSLQIQAKPSMMTPEGGGGGAHRHGGADKKKGAKKGAAPMSMLPAMSRRQISAVAAAAKDAIKAVEGKDLAKIHSAFDAFEKAINDVDMEPLEALENKQMHMQWMEISMRLLNDALEGKEAKTLKDAGDVVKNWLLANLDSLKLKFDLSGAAAAPSSPAVSAEFRKQLAKVLDAYMKTLEALARDNHDGAIAAVREAANALKGVDMKLLAGDAHMLWMKQSKEIGRILAAAAKAKDIEALREEFAKLSEQMASVIKYLGGPAKTIYKFKCAMAFDGRGAVWLQKDKQTRNPYYGAQMPGCGKVIEVIKARVAGEAGDDVHE